MTWTVLPVELLLRELLLLLLLLLLLPLCPPFCAREDVRVRHRIVSARASVIASILKLALVRANILGSFGVELFASGDLDNSRPAGKGVSCARFNADSITSDLVCLTRAVTKVSATHWLFGTISFFAWPGWEH